ncbi:alpha/beta hydrolase [Tundrisphaera sp. TA3]|uniref:alpha/beta hydrolase n=1 Tax=Tundrisphaera sp. TA3 TaxID=3435775 RepID=UPI003EB7BCF1
MRTSAAIALGILLATAPAIPAPAAEPPAPTTMEIWPKSPPGDDAPIDPEKATTRADGTITSLTNVSKPTITVRRPGPDKANELAMVICPGGGYNNLAWDHEGEQVARWLNEIGVTAVLLKYRVPRRPGTPKGEQPVQALMDAQRALSLTRAHAAEWGIDAKRIGILGFSAGGHLAAWASTQPDHRAYEAVDDSDRASCRPDFAVVIYPGGIYKRGETEIAREIAVTEATPPMFIAMSNDDPVGPENAAHLYLALKRSKVPAELHIYATGGHGYGLRPRDDPSSSWPRRCEEWLRHQKLMPTPGK